MFYRFRTAHYGLTATHRAEWRPNSEACDALVNLGAVLYAAPLDPTEDLGPTDEGHDHVTCLHMVGGKDIRIWMTLDELQRLLVEHARLIEG